LIEEAGLKGKCIGGAEVSTIHANFIVAKEGATAHDVCSLIQTVKEQVEQKTGICLECEIRMIGHG
jgi:UDP-N-acetylmuramate dehydrogenase